MTAIASVLERLNTEFARYFGSALLALALDSALFLGLHAFGVPTAWAATFGYLAGLLLIYRLSVRWVFACRSVVDRRLEFVLFAAVGLGGLGLSVGLLQLFVDGWQWAPTWAKAAVASKVFLFNFGLRKVLLFSVSAKVRLA
jgi:putative flippase GtrA